MKLGSPAWLAKRRKPHMHEWGEQRVGAPKEHWAGLHYLIQQDCPCGARIEQTAVQLRYCGTVEYSDWTITPP